MKRLEKLGLAARQAELAFDAACSVHYCDARHGYYKADKRGDVIPEGLHEKCDEYLAACRAFYLERDTKNGFLGSKDQTDQGW